MPNVTALTTRTGKMTDLQRIPPQSLQTERCVLAGCIMHSEAMAIVQSIIVSSDFYAAAHQMIFDAVVSLGGGKIDIVMVANRLRQNNELDKIGGEAYLAELLELWATPETVGPHCAELKRLSSLRKIISAANNATIAAYDDCGAIPDGIIEVFNAHVACGATKDNSIPVHISEVIPETMDEIERAHRGERLGILSGIAPLDQSVGWFTPGDLVIIAGRPGSGKSALMSSIAVNMAIAGEPTTTFSLEMQKTKICKRMISAFRSVPLKGLRLGTLNRAELTTMGQAVGDLAGLPIYVSDCPRLAEPMFTTRAKAMKRKNNCRVFFIDYLGLMEKPESERESLGIANITKALKRSAMELNSVIFLGCQLNRLIEQGSGKKPRRPVLSDLRDSGAIEQDADMVIFTHITQEAHELVVGKQRDGEVGVVTGVHFNKNYCRWEEKGNGF
jgi:replicative DNA helicase